MRPVMIVSASLLFLATPGTFHDPRNTLAALMSRQPTLPSPTSSVCSTPRISFLVVYKQSSLSASKRRIPSLRLHCLTSSTRLALALIPGSLKMFRRTVSPQTIHKRHLSLATLVSSHGCKTISERYILLTLPYPHSVRNAIKDFTHQAPARNPYAEKHISAKTDKKIEMTSPIPGFTGFIPESRTCYSMTFGKTSEVAYDQFNHRDEKGYLNITKSCKQRQIKYYPQEPLC
jgi:hypothetical protein